MRSSAKAVNGSKSQFRGGSKSRARRGQSLEQAIVGLAKRGDLAKPGQRAIQRLLRKEIPVIFKRGNQIIKQYADGREEVLKSGIPSVSFTPPSGVKIIEER